MCVLVSLCSLGVSVLRILAITGLIAIWWHLQTASVCTNLKAKDFGHVSILLPCYLYIFVGEVSVQVVHAFSSWAGVLFCLVSFCWIFKTLSLNRVHYRMYLWDIFFSVCSVQMLEFLNIYKRPCCWYFEWDCLESIDWCGNIFSDTETCKLWTWNFQYTIYFNLAK